MRINRLHHTLIDQYDAHLKTWLLQPHYLVMFMFAVVCGTLHGAGQAQCAGAVLCVTCFFRYLSGHRMLRGLVPLELKFYTAWGVWAILTGILVHKSTPFFFQDAKVLVQMIIMLWAVTMLLTYERSESFFYWALLLVAGLNLCAVLMGLDYTRVAGEMVLQDDIEIGEKRIGGLTGNGNALGNLFIMGIWAMLMLWKWMRKRVALIGLVLMGIGVVGLSYYIVQTGSRKSLLSVAGLVGAWVVWMLPGHNRVRAVLLRIVLGAGLIVLVPIATAYVMGDTVVGRRFQSMIDSGGGSAVAGFTEANIRWVLIQDGIRFWVAHPVFGLGLGQFRVYHWSGLYSHSDYIEPLATTGTIGFILYQGFAVVILARLMKLLKYHLPEDVDYTIKGMVLFLVFVHFVMGFGCPHWSIQLHEVVVMFCGVTSCRYWREYVLCHRPIGS